MEITVGHSCDFEGLVVGALTEERAFELQISDVELNFFFILIEGRLISSFICSISPHSSKSGVALTIAILLHLLYRLLESEPLSLVLLALDLLGHFAIHMAALSDDAFD